MASAMGALASAPCAASRLGLPRRLPTRPPLPGPLTWVRRAAPAPKATAVSQHLLGAAVKVAALVPDLAASAGSSLAAAIDLGVLGATINASAKLFLICAAVGWLLRSGRIPNSTSTVLSKVSFEILIPAMLFTKAVADRALGYAALFLLAWSPCLWSIGLALVSGQQGQALRAPQLGNGGGGQALGASRQEHLQQADETVARRPLYWREPRVVDITPLTAQSNSTGKDDKLALPEPPGWAEKLAVHPTTAKLCQFAAQAGCCLQCWQIRCCCLCC
ncbi:hypothetical protein CHLNCDRAFT_59420 [Chlorella variabilis]|uniref:Uncharacterized protein n=1 Tax=Chlorella variabilis TaxID=554065 RepID=E1ZTN3_CHLVA|nr:hypothetical protein CHLNCDRAFT_59420 [Chlorella variabilis]EFN50869.1 hypothetical protein CHLNCDRAFT_59420 [Chlorella variabilis]|eukprot:XP_005842971.1 hypothetical protein CHLNCDRAFT_59420 [Chlorella variabilis]